eukprot:917341-Pelagomonas_calceolata.AAC.1
MSKLPAHRKHGKLMGTWRGIAARSMLTQTESAASLNTCHGVSCKPHVRVIFRIDHDVLRISYLHPHVAWSKDRASKIWAGEDVNQACEKDEGSEVLSTSRNDERAA